MSTVAAKIQSPSLCRPPALALLTLGLFIVMQVYTLPALAIGSFKPSKQQLAMLPPYCGPRAETWGNDASRPEVAHWIRMFGGKNWIHMHHYCFMLLSVNMANSSFDRNERRGAYKRAMNELAYMEKSVSPDFILWPEMRLYRTIIEGGLRY